jgi:hypothetical protein
MDRFTGAWTPALVTAEADRLFPTITIGLMFPSAAWPIAVDGGGMGRAMRSPPFPLPPLVKGPPSLT